MNDEYKPPLNEIQGWMCAAELDFLYKTSKTMDSVLEIGSWKGRSTHALASGCNGTVISIDTFEGNPTEIDGFHKEAKTTDIRLIFNENIKEFKNVFSLKGDSQELSKMFGPKSIDMIFIDGEHTKEAVMKDVHSWLPICKRGFFGHDVFMPGVNEGLSILKKEGFKIKRIVDSIWNIEL